MLHIRAILTPAEAKRIIMADLALSKIETLETKEDRHRKRSQDFKRTGETE